MCDYMCGRKATKKIGLTNICSVCNAADKKVPFGENISFFDAWHAYEAGYGILSAVSDYVKYKNRTKAPAQFTASEIRGKWKVLRN